MQAEARVRQEPLVVRRLQFAPNGVLTKTKESSKSCGTAALGDLNDNHGAENQYSTVTEHTQAH